MKKFLALLLAVLMIASMSVTAFAADDTDPADDLATQLGGAESNTLDEKDVTVVSKLTENEAVPDIVYHVVVVWKALDFQFDFTVEQSAMIWDPVSHTYKTSDGNDDDTALDALTGSWVDYSASVASTDDNGATAKVEDAIVVTNHSNNPVKVTAAIDNTEKNGVTTSINDKDTAVNLPSAEGLGVSDEKLVKKYTVSVSGVPTIVDGFTIGTVSLTFAVGDTNT